MWILAQPGTSPEVHGVVHNVPPGTREQGFCKIRAAQRASSAAFTEVPSCSGAGLATLPSTLPWHPPGFLWRPSRRKNLIFQVPGTHRCCVSGTVASKNTPAAFRTRGPSLWPIESDTQVLRARPDFWQRDMAGGQRARFTERGAKANPRLPRKTLA